ncbi:MAG: FAD-binding domain-containing protein, partial [Alphaproteobacteria bacterium]
MNTKDLFCGLEQAETITFTPTRQAGLARLEQFALQAGLQYAKRRNYDFGVDRRGNVSALSPWIRHRLVTEEEVLRAILARHSVSGAEKFVQEVFWRTYFKGWLEQHPSVWTAYQHGLMQALGENHWFAEYKEAVKGRTGIDCFDHWARELVETGYLHNHARMWFASIWIFTLRLPWELGADFFLRHLIDGDPASNTLSWRWVGGLHTKGKTYLARASNIAKYTDGRFNPQGQLSSTADPLIEQ